MKKLKRLMSMRGAERGPKRRAVNSARRQVLNATVALTGNMLMAHTALAASGGLSRDEYLSLDATAMAAAVRAGQLDPVELLRAAQTMCDTRNAVINAVNMRHDALAHAALKARDKAGLRRQGALAGVPMLIKDLNTYLAGTLTDHACRFWAGSPPAAQSSTIVERYQQAGSVIFGKTACPEFGLTTTTESMLYGKTRNPWNLAMSAGGSSGGAAAAVAAGMIPAAHATDGGGSIRIPASYCGVFGLKPSRYRTPTGPMSFESWFGAGTGHVVSRTVRDSALMLDVVQGHEFGSPYWLSPLERPFVEEVMRSPGKLHIGLVSASLTGLRLDPAVTRVLDDSVHLLTRLGHEVESLRLPISAPELFGAHGVVVGTALLMAIRNREKQLESVVSPADLEPTTWDIFRVAQGFSSEALYRARQSFEEISRQMAHLFEHVDVILSPVTAHTTPTLGELSLAQPYDSFINVARENVAFTIVANVSGIPSMSVPLGQSDDGMPIGMMFSAPLAAEARLFRLAGQLEQERPWIGKYPKA